MRQRAQRILCAVAGALALLFAQSSAVFAQCAMCRAALGNSAEAAKASSGMNLAVMVLLIPPVALFCALFIVAYRFRKAPGEAVPATNDEQSIQGRARDRESKDSIGRGRIRGDGGSGDGPRAVAEAI